jgi:hypothetical protein
MGMAFVAHAGFVTAPSVEPIHIDKHAAPYLRKLRQEPMLCTGA